MRSNNLWKRNACPNLPSEDWKQNQHRPSKEILLTVVVIASIFGSLALAILDETYREPFLEIAKISIAGFFGWMMPNSGGCKNN